MNDKELIDRIIANTRLKITSGHSVTYMNRAGRILTRDEIAKVIKVNEKAFATDIRNSIRFTAILSDATNAAAYIIKKNIDKIRAVPNCEMGVIDYIVVPMSMRDFRPYLYESTAHFIVGDVCVWLDGAEMFSSGATHDELNNYEKGLLTKVKKQAWLVRKDVANRDGHRLPPKVKRLLLSA